MIILSNGDVDEILSMPQAIEVVSAAMITVSRGETTLPLRSIMPVGGGNNMGMMPGAMQDPSCFGIKLISLYPQNPKVGFSSHQGAMVMFESEYGAAIGMMNSDRLTAIRTAAASGVATRALAREDASRLAIIGYGEQAGVHLDAMVAVRPVETVVVAGRNAESAAKFAKEAAKRYPELAISSTGSVQEAVKDTDIICTVTATDEPVLFGTWVAPGTHLNIVGSSIPSKREIDTDLVARASMYVDYRPSTMAQAGEFKLAIDEGRVNADHIRAEIGELLAGEATGRSSDDEITLYRSLGVAAQDLACAHFVLEQAKELGKGIKVSLD
jgi:ornithine cyclodeaminase